MMVQIRREAAELLRTQTMIQGMRTVDEDSGETVKKAYESYLQARAPFLKKQIAEEDKKLMQEMRSWTRQGPMMVRAIKEPNPRVQSRLAEKQHGRVPSMRKAAGW